MKRRGPRRLDEDDAEEEDADAADAAPLLAEDELAPLDELAATVVSANRGTGGRARAPLVVVTVTLIGVGGDGDCSSSSGVRWSEVGERCEARWCSSASVVGERLGQGKYTSLADEGGEILIDKPVVDDEPPDFSGGGAVKEA